MNIQSRRAKFHLIERACAKLVEPGLVPVPGWSGVVALKNSIDSTYQRPPSIADTSQLTSQLKINLVHFGPVLNNHNLVDVLPSMAESGVTEAGLRATLVEKLQATHVEIEDISGGCGQSFSALIVSPQFAKKPTLARHRLVNTALKAEIAAIHAWTPRCYTPAEWEKVGGAASGPGKTVTVTGTQA